MTTARLLALAAFAAASIVGATATAQSIGKCSVADSEYLCNKDGCSRIPLLSATDTGSNGPACDAGCSGTTDACCASGCGSTCGGCCDETPFELFPRTCSGWKIGGWIQMGYHTEGANGDGTNLFNNYPSVVQMQQAWVYAEKEANTCGCGWDWGFRFDYVYGTDGQDTQAFGNRCGAWDEDWDNGGYYGHAIPQLYTEVAYCDLKVKIGHFYTILGYETVPAPDNFFYSHAYSMALAEPFTHTGALAEWTLGDGGLTLYGGWTQGWDTGYSNNQGNTFLGGISLQLTDHMSITYATTMGDFGFGPGGSDSDAYAHSIVVDWEIADRLTYVFQSDYGDNQLLVDNMARGLAGNQVMTNGKVVSINQYLLYSVNDCWAFGTRAEWFRAGGMAEIIDLTFGANIRPHANLLIRPEVRLDDFDSVPDRQDSTVFGIDAIVTF